MTRDIVVIPEAEAEIAEAVAWFEHSARRGDAFLHTLDATLSAIARDPNQHPVAFAGVRAAMLPGFPYAVMYVPFMDEIVVVA